MDVDPTIDAVLALYPQVWHALHRVHPTDRSDVSPRDTSVLVHVGAHDGISPGALAAHLGVANGTLSEALGSLEARGLVLRARDPRDKRRVALHLTDDGRRAVRVGSGLDPDRLGRALSALTDAERDQIVAGLGLLARAAVRS